MGNDSSSVDADEAALLAQRVDHGGVEDIDEAAAEFCGFRVLGIQEQSPASRVGFVSFFDFILSANGIRLDTRDSTFMELIAQSEEQPMELEVYNLKSQTTRQLSLTPSRQWPGKGLLGVTIRFDSYEHAEDQLLHVLDVVRRSPADVAGLRPETDYLLGTPERVFRGPDDLHDEMLDAQDDAFQCYVYNTEEDQVRIVRIAPSDKWGGGGVLGAEVGHGVLHRLPTACRETVGTSIGFVSLSEEAKAATDPYLRHVRNVDAATRRSESPQATTQVDPPAPAPDTEAAATSDGEETTATNEAIQQATRSRVEEEVSGTESMQTTSQASTSAPAPAAAPQLGPEGVAAAAPEVPVAKPRYAARIDPRFPMSTVVVLADPTQLN